MKRLWIVLLLAPIIAGAGHFKWAVPDANREAVLTAMEQAVPGFGFRGPGARGTIGGDTVTVQQHDRFTPAQYAALVAVFDSLRVAHGPYAVGFVPLPPLPMEYGP